MIIILAESYNAGRVIAFKLNLQESEYQLIQNIKNLRKFRKPLVIIPTTLKKIVDDSSWMTYIRDSKATILHEELLDAYRTELGKEL